MRGRWERTLVRDDWHLELPLVWWRWWSRVILVIIPSLMLIWLMVGPVLVRLGWLTYGETMLLIAPALVPLILGVRDTLRLSPDGVAMCRRVRYWPPGWETDTAIPASGIRDVAIVAGVRENTITVRTWDARLVVHHFGGGAQRAKSVVERVAPFVRCEFSTDGVLHTHEPSGKT